MYLDTDVLLALIKSDDWLKSRINFKRISKPKTSIISALECQIVLEREEGRKFTVSVLQKLNENDLLP